MQENVTTPGLPKSLCSIMISWPDPARPQLPAPFAPASVAGTEPSAQGPLPPIPQPPGGGGGRAVRVEGGVVEGLERGFGDAEALQHAGDVVHVDGAVERLRG